MKKFLLPLYFLFILISPNSIAAERVFISSAYESIKVLHKAIFETKNQPVKNLDVFKTAEQLATYEQRDLMFTLTSVYKENLGAYFFTQLSTKIMLLELAIAKIDSGSLNEKEIELYKLHIIYGFNDIIQLLNKRECVTHASQILSEKVIIDLIMLMGRAQEYTLNYKIDLIHHFPRYVVEKIISVITNDTIRNSLHSKYKESSIAGALGAMSFMIKHSLLAYSEFKQAFSMIEELAKQHEPALLPWITLLKKSINVTPHYLKNVQELEKSVDSPISTEEALFLARNKEFAWAINYDLSLVKSLPELNSFTMSRFNKRISYLGWASIELLKEGKYNDALVTLQLLDYIVTQLGQSIPEKEISMIDTMVGPYVSLGLLCYQQSIFNALHEKPFIPGNLKTNIKNTVDQLTEIYNTLNHILQTNGENESKVLLKNFAQAISLDNSKLMNLMLMDKDVFKKGLELPRIIAQYEIFHKLIAAHALQQSENESEKLKHAGLLSKYVSSFAGLANSTALRLDAELLQKSSNSFAWSPQLNFLSQELANYFNPTQGREHDIFGPELDNYNLGDFVASNQLFNYLIFVRKNALLNSAPDTQIKILISYIETLIRINFLVSHSNNEKLKFFEPHDLWLPDLLAHLGTLIKTGEVDSDVITLVTNMAITAYSHDMSSATEKELVKLLDLIKKFPNKFYPISSKNSRAIAVAAYAKLSNNFKFKPYFKVQLENSGDWTIFVDIKEPATKQAQNKFADLSGFGFNVKNEKDKTTLICNNSNQCTKIFNAVNKMRPFGITIDKKDDKLVFIYNPSLFVEAELVKIDKTCECIKSHKLALGQKSSPLVIKEEPSFNNYSSPEPARERISRAPKASKTVEKNYNKEPQPETKAKKLKKSNKSKIPKQSNNNNITTKISFEQKIELQRKEAELERISQQKERWQELTGGPALSGEKPKVIVEKEYPAKDELINKLEIKESVHVPENRKLLIDLMSHAIHQISELFNKNHADEDLFYSLYSPMLILSEVLFKYIDDVINSDDNFIICGFSKDQLFMFKSLRDDILKDITRSKHNKQLIDDFNGLSLMLYKHLPIALEVFKNRLHHPESTATFNLDWPLIEEKIATLSLDIKNDTERIAVKEEEPIEAMMDKFWNLDKKEKQSLKARGIVAMAGVLADPITVKEKGRISLVRDFRNQLAHAKKTPNGLEDSMNSRLEFLVREDIKTEIINELKALLDT